MKQSTSVHLHYRHPSRLIMCNGAPQWTKTVFNSPNRRRKKMSFLVINQSSCSEVVDVTYCEGFPHTCLTSDSMIVDSTWSLRVGWQIWGFYLKPCCHTRQRRLGDDHLWCLLRDQCGSTWVKPVSDFLRMQMRSEFMWRNNRHAPLFWLWRNDSRCARSIRSGFSSSWRLPETGCL